MSERINHRKASPEGYKLIIQLHQYIARCGLDEALIHLVYLRTSQINGCAFCVDMHSDDALKAGVSQRKLNQLSVWRESPLYDERERAALNWTESLTNVAQTHAPDPDYDAMLAHFNAKELADLTYAIGLMNLLNRIGVGFRLEPSAGD
ncbi:MAG: carboxymuconolactone decarboxylase family protein [bacterium]|nr:carboxymuconolactone decarboxylase family protein [bacterium]